MFEHEDTFEEEFSNWAKAVLNLQNVRDGSISYIKNKIEPFIDELVHMHGPNEEEHFEELLIKVAVNGEVKKNKSKKNTNAHQWNLYDKKCTTCVNVFKKILDNFKDSCSCKRWERHASKDSISPSNYWWIVSKLYISHNCEIETSLGPQEVEPLAVLSLMSRCRLFHGNLLWFDVGQVLLSRHELMHSINNRLSDDKRDDYLLEMKTLIKKVEVDTSTTEVLKSFEEVEHLTVALFTEDGEIHQLANKALQLQNNCLNADFKSPKGVHTTMKSLAMSKIESKSQELKLKNKDQLEKMECKLQKRELERKNAQLETQIQQHKIEELERKLQNETDKNKTYEDNLTEIRSNMENKFEDLEQEIGKQDDKMSCLKSKIDELERKLHYETERNKLYGDNLTEIRSNMENKFEDLQHEIKKQDGEMSSLNSKMGNKFENLRQEQSKQAEEISSLGSKKEIKFKNLQLEKSKHDDEVSSLKNTISDSQVYEVQSFVDVGVRVDFDELTCIITHMCQMSNGTVILIDFSNNKLKRLDDEFNIKDFYQFDEKPFYVVPVSSSKVAVLHNNSNIHVNIILLDENIVIEKSVVLEGELYITGGMIYCNDQFWIHRVDGLYVYSSSGSLVKCIENLSIDMRLSTISTCTICTNKDKTRVYVIKHKRAYVLNTDGEILSTFSLREYQAYITVTRDDNLIISSSDSVDVFDKDGKRLGRLISKTDMLANPQSMLYDENKCCLIIASWQEDNIRVFQLKNKDNRQETTHDFKTS